MGKTKILSIKVEPEFHERLKLRSEETGIPYSEVVRRALELWLTTGEMPKLLQQKGGKHKIK